METMELMIKKK